MDMQPRNEEWRVRRREYSIFAVHAERNTTFRDVHVFVVVFVPMAADYWDPRAGLPIVRGFSPVMVDGIGGLVVVYVESNNAALAHGDMPSLSRSHVAVQDVA